MSQNGGILLFGLGAPKAGTSWLHGYLAGHPEVFVPPMKELHFFNSVDGNLSGRLQKLASKKARLEKRLERTGKGAHALKDLQAVSQLTKSGSDDAYLDYMRAGAAGQSVMADLTPAYGLLSVERLQRMQKMAESRFIFLMRDPVARLWSNIRMVAVRQQKAGDSQPLDQMCGDLLSQVLAGKAPSLQQRSDYAGILAKIAKLDPKRVLCAFFEDLFTNDTVTRICDFLEIAVMPADFGRRINEGQAVALADADRVRAAAYLKPQYAAAKAHMGRLPDAWKQNAGVA